MEVVVLWFLMPCSDVVGYYYPEDGVNMVIRKFAILPENYTSSQPRRTRLGATTWISFWFPRRI